VIQRVGSELNLEKCLAWKQPLSPGGQLLRTQGQVSDGLESVD
jgi:hypothetical protein